MGKQLILAIIALISCGSALAANPFESFVGTYQVTSILSCVPEDSDCRSLQKIRVERVAGSSVIQIVEIRGAKETPTKLIEMPCPELLCYEFANIEGVPGSANWGYSKEIPSTSPEKYDHKSFSETRRLNKLGDIVSYDFGSSVTDEPNSRSFYRTYQLKKVRTLMEVFQESSLDQEF